jgi:hypothetical protein
MVKTVDKRAAIEQAHAEIEQENMAKGVKLLKAKLRELQVARTVLENLQREVTDLEQSIEDGNA